MTPIYDAKVRANGHNPAPDIPDRTLRQMWNAGVPVDQPQPRWRTVTTDHTEPTERVVNAPPCGTYAAYQRHYRRGQPIDQECRENQIEDGLLPDDGTATA